MNVKELIKVLETLDPNIPVCGESETGSWDIKPQDIFPVRDVYVHKEPYPIALVLGYQHCNYEEAK